jgi:uncharacterized protein involved in outer membrane biogenesis
MAVLVLLLFLLRPGASRLKSRIIVSMSASLGRSVDIGAVNVRLLPRPGFDLENLVVYDDPAFGAEPILRAGSVNAALRLTSLLRGRMEISRLELTEPSLNLVHGQRGGWNLEALLERTAHMPLAPTGKTKPGSHIRFPYIEATSARINFKNGPEKKPYALTNADFSLWQDSDNSWGVRLRAQPVRTDLNLNDTGTLRINGTWQRAESLHDTPVEFSLEWDRAQLGQLTKFFTGSDQGWRGGVQLEASASGTPGQLKISTDATVQDFRRYDITAGQALRLAAHCDAQYDSGTKKFSAMLCHTPVADGQITLRGSFSAIGPQESALTLAAEKVPAAALLALAQHSKKNLPEDLSATGLLDGSFHLEKDPSAALRSEGHGEISELRLDSASLKSELGPVTIPFRLTGEKPGAVKGSTGKGPMGKRSALEGRRVEDGPRVEVGPVVSDGGRTTATAWLNRTGYGVTVKGEADIAHALRTARLMGIPALQTTAEGAAQQIDLQVAGSWPRWAGTNGFPGPQVTGAATLHNVRVPLAGAGGRLEIASAILQLQPEAVRVEKIVASAADANWTGSIEMPRGCGTPGACEIHFDLSASQIALVPLLDWVKSSPKERPWYRVLESDERPVTFLGSLRASGRIVTEHLAFHSLIATHASARVTLDQGHLQLEDISAELLNGKYRGSWQADFGVKPASFRAKGTLDGISLDRLSDAMKDSWITGTGNVSYQFTAAGASAAEFWQSAEGTVTFDARNGSLAHISLNEGDEPLHLATFSGQARVRDGKLELSDARLDSGTGKFQINGNYSFNHALNFKLERLPAGTSGYAITGTLAQPRVTPLAGTEQARLKPDPPKQ